MFGIVDFVCAVDVVVWVYGLVVFGLCWALWAAWCLVFGLVLFDSLLVWIFAVCCFCAVGFRLFVGFWLVVLRCCLFYLSAWRCLMLIATFL